MDNRFYIIILLFTYFLLKINRYWLNRSKYAIKEGFASIKTYQNVDELLKKLSKSESVSLLVSNNIIMPWVKNMEIHEAEQLYNKLFLDSIDSNYLIKDIIYGLEDNKGNTILSPINGVDKRIENLISDKKDIYEYIAYIDFLEKNHYKEIDNWGRQLGFNLVKSSGTNIITSVISPSLNSLKAKKSISLNLPEVTNEDNIKYNFKFSEIKTNIYDLSKLEEKDYRLSFPSTFPDELKYRIRNNVSSVQATLGNIINSFGLKQGLEWQKLYNKGKLISDTTINLKNIFNMKIKKLRKLKNIDIENYKRPKELLSKKCVKNNLLLELYNNIINISNKKFDSENALLPDKLINRKGQVLLENSKDKIEITNFLRVLRKDNYYIFKNEYNGIISENIKPTEGNDILGFPWYFNDPEPYSWKDSRDKEMSKKKIQLRRMKVNKNKEIVELSENDKINLLVPGQIIYGPNNTILARIESNIITDINTQKIISETVIFKDKFYNDINIPDINQKISWKLESLKKLFESSNNIDLKKQISLINILLVKRANALRHFKEAILNEMKEHHMTMQNVIRITLNKYYESKKKNILVGEEMINIYKGNVDIDERCILSLLAEFLTDYSLIISPNSPLYSVNDIKVMNRKNFVSILENGLQSLERVLIKNRCIERESYPNGPELLDVTKNKINFILSDDILRLQRAIYSSLNNSISKEDNLNDIVYASIRFKLLLKEKNNNYSFITNRIIDNFKKENIIFTIDLIEKISFKDIFLDDLYFDNVSNIISNSALTLERLNELYEYLTLDEYFSIKLDLINDSSTFVSYLNDIDNNINMNDNLKVKGYNAINSLKNRIGKLSNIKKQVILEIIKENIFNRHKLSYDSYDSNLKNKINKNITLMSEFRFIKYYTYENPLIELLDESELLKKYLIQEESN